MRASLELVFRARLVAKLECRRCRLYLTSMYSAIAARAFRAFGAQTPAVEGERDQQKCYPCARFNVTLCSRLFNGSWPRIEIVLSITKVSNGAFCEVFDLGDGTVLKAFFEVALEAAPHADPTLSARVAFSAERNAYLTIQH